MKASESAFSTTMVSDAPPRQLHIDAFADDVAVKSVELSLREKQICFVVPAGARIDAFTMDLPGGMLVLGALRGKVTCAVGSIIIAKGGEFQGYAEAEDIYIEGKVTSPTVAPGVEMTKMKARGRVMAAHEGVSSIQGGLIAVSAQASIRAHLLARMFHIPRHADLNKSMMETL